MFFSLHPLKYKGALDQITLNDRNLPDEVQRFSTLISMGSLKPFLLFFVTHANS